MPLTEMNYELSPPTNLGNACVDVPTSKSMMIRGIKFEQMLLFVAIVPALCCPDRMLQAQQIDGAPAVGSSDAFKPIVAEANPASTADALEVLQQNRVTCTFSPAHNIWIIQMSGGRANMRTLRALSRLLESSQALVDLPWNKLDQEEFAVLGSIGGIIELNLADTGVRDEDLAALSKLRSLNELCLSRAKITDEGLRHLQPFGELETLRLEDTRITGHGISYLKTLPKLQHLYISGTRVDDASCKELAQLKSIQTLYISRTAIGDEGLKSLLELDNLQELMLTKSKVTREGARAFKAQHTERHIAAIKAGEPRRVPRKPVIVGIQ